MKYVPINNFYFIILNIKFPIDYIRFSPTRSMIVSSQMLRYVEFACQLYPRLLLMFFSSHISWPFISRIDSLDQLHLVPYAKLIC